jgi:purine-binding chemotaxis protein CheW
VARDERGLTLLCRVDRRLCALPLALVVETMRPQPLERVAGAPDFVLGVAVIRGEPVPVVDAAALVGAESSRPARLVTLRVRGRKVALAVDEVVGIRPMAPGSQRDLPPLLRDARADVVSSIGARDAELLLVLESARMVPDEVWTAIATQAGSA